MVGMNGSGTEKSFDPVKAALSDPLISNYNFGFYRPEAHLAIIFITDAEDQSDMTEDQFLDFLRKLKPQPEKVLAYGAIIPTGEPNCPRDDSRTPMRIEYVLSKVSNAGKNTMSLCDSQYGDRLSALSADLLKRIGNTIYLKRLPILKSIRLVYGTMILPQDSRTGWAYDPERNVIVLGSNIDWQSQPTGTKLKIYYDAVDLD
jgi:hypothetical protein